VPAQAHNPPGLSMPAGYSHITIVPAGRQVHVSGQVALDAAREIVGRGDLAAQAEQVYDNIEAALAGAGARLTDVFKVVTYVVDLTPEKAAVVRAVRNRRLGAGPYPAATMVGVTGLVDPAFLIEVEVIATLD
jgi:enamine deaminase RidA (YjgF/YER057c/UK114 family)